MNGKYIGSTRFLTVLAATVLVAGSALAETSDSGSGCSDASRSHDRWLDTRLETAYLFNPHLNNFAIDTDVDGGVVTLSGTVKSDIDRDLAEQIAKSLDGVTKVKNSLKVSDDAKPKAKTSAGDDFFRKVRDATITAEVKTKLIANGNITAADIDVDTEDRVVTLSGRVQSDTQKELAGLIARNTSGVDSVVNHLEKS